MLQENARALGAGVFGARPFHAGYPSVSQVPEQTKQMVIKAVITKFVREQLDCRSNHICARE